MDVPAAVDAVLDGESVAARIPLRGEDALFVTGSRTVAYRADGLLSDESVTEYSHDAERVTVSEGRRKSKVVLDYGLDGEETLTVPAGKLDDALHPILAGVLNRAGVTGPGETVKRTYRFSELTLVVTSARLVKHVGSAVWETDCEEIVFENVTDIGAEEGNVASQLVLETPDRTQRIKAPNESFRDVRETVEDALFAAHDAATYEEFRHSVEREVAADEDGGGVAFDNDDLSPLGGDETTAGAEVADTGTEPSAVDDGTPEPAVDVAAVRAELDDLAETVTEQKSLLEEQQRLIEDQERVIEEQRTRIQALRDAIPDQ